MTSPGGGKSTTIGKAVLEIIPSLRGVSDAIEQQIDGKVVEVKVTPKVDPKAAETAGQQTRETVEKHTRDVKVEPKVDTRAAEQAGKATGEAVTKGANDAVRKGDIGKTVSDEVTETVKKSSPGKDLAKIIVDGLADGARDELRGGPFGDVLIGGLAESVKQGIDRGGVGRTTLDAISRGMKSGNPAGAIRDAILPGIKQVGTDIRSGATEWSKGVADALRGGDIQGATDNIGSKVRTTTDLIANIGSTFGLQLDGVRQFGDGSASTLETIGGDVQGIVDKAVTMRSTFVDTGDLLETVLPGRAGRGAAAIMSSLGKIIPIAGGVYDALDLIATRWHAENEERFWERNNANRRAEDIGLRPPQPGVGDFGGAPRSAPLPPPVAPDLQSKVQAGLLPGFSMGPNGTIIDNQTGQPVTIPKGVIPGSYDSGGYTGSKPVDQIAGVVHGEEFVVQATSQRSIEKQWPGYLDYMNKTGRLPGYESGGRVDKAKQFARSMDPATYLMGGFSTSQIDCSGLVSAVVNVATGRPPFQSRMSTVTEGSWLASLGFKPGRGGAGDLRVGWWDKGGGANGHTAGTLPDGTNFESNGTEGVVIGGRTGADDRQFTQHAYLPMDSIGNPNGPGSSSAPDMLSALGLGGSAAGGGGSSSVGSAVVGGASSSRSASGGSSGGGSSVRIPSSITGLATLGIDSLPNPTDGLPDTLPDGTKNPWKQESAIKFNEAASAAVGGQVSSLLGVAGVPDSPGWLQGISQLVGGIKIGGGSDGGFGSAAPAAAAGVIGGLGGAGAASQSMHGGQAGAQPGPTVNYTINARDTEDAFVRAQQQEKERIAAKLTRF